MLLQKLQTLTEIEAVLASELKRVRAERKALEAKQTKLNNWLELQSELLSDPDIADTLVGGAQTPEAPRLIEIEDSDDAQIERLLSMGVQTVQEAEHLIQAKKEVEAKQRPTPEREAEQSQKLRDAAAKLTVVWDSISNGKTVDSEGAERKFHIKKWDAYKLLISLETSSGKIIESSWKNTGIANNSHFYAIRRESREQFLKECREMGFILSPIDGDLLSRSFAVYGFPDYEACKAGKRLGTITQSFDELWHFGNERFKYAHIQDCLAALKIEIEAKQAADIGF